MTIGLAGAVVMGLLGSLHCAGMCGPLAAGACGRRPLTSSGALSLFVLSKGGTYAALGALCGALHCALVRVWGAPELQAGIGVVCGALMISLGIAGLGRWKRIAWSPGAVATPRGASLLRAIALGALAGLLPCGLTYAMLAHAASAPTVGEGAAIMAAFGAGTAPALVLAGWLVRWSGARLRRWAQLLSSYGVVLLGGYTLVRAILGFLVASNGTCCP